MKAFKTTILILFAAMLLTSCFDDPKETFEGAQIEFEDAVMRARATGEIFPIITVGRTAGTPSYQINLIGRWLTQEENIGFSMEEVPERLLNATTIRAVEGVHYSLNGNALPFPVETSTTSFQGVNVLATSPAQPGKTALLIIRLDGNDKITPAENFRRLGIRINLN